MYKRGLQLACSPAGCEGLVESSHSGAGLMRDLSRDVTERWGSIRELMLGYPRRPLAKDHPVRCVSAFLCWRVAIAAQATDTRTTSRAADLTMSQAMTTTKTIINLIVHSMSSRTMPIMQHTALARSVPRWPH